MFCFMPPSHQTFMDAFLPAGIAAPATLIFCRSRHCGGKNQLTCPSLLCHVVQYWLLMFTSIASTSLGMNSMLHIYFTPTIDGSQELLRVRIRRSQVNAISKVTK